MSADWQETDRPGLVRHTTDSLGLPLPPGHSLWLPPTAPPKLTPAEAEAERVAKLAAARQDIAAVADAQREAAALRPQQRAIEAEKMAAADACEAACAPLRKILADLKVQLDTQRKSGKPLSPALLRERDKLQAEIQQHLMSLHLTCAECDERLGPIQAELRRLSSIIVRERTARESLIENAEPEIATRIFVASSSARWAEARLRAATANGSSVPPQFREAEAAAARAALDAAQAESQAAFVAAIES